jgi:hypothetical protein
MNVTSLSGLESGISHEFHIACSTAVRQIGARPEDRPAIVAGDDNDVEMDGELALPTEETNLCQYS